MGVKCQCLENEGWPNGGNCVQAITSDRERNTTIIVPQHEAQIIRAVFDFILGRKVGDTRMQHGDDDALSFWKSTDGRVLR